MRYRSLTRCVCYGVLLALLAGGTALHAQTTSRIVFDSTRDGDDLGGEYPPDVFIMDDDGTDQINLTDRPDKRQRDATICGTSKIVYSSDTSGTDDIWIMDADGGNPANLTYDLSNSSERHPHCTYINGGTKIVYSSDTNSSLGEIYSMDEDGTNRARLTNNAFVDRDPEWCKDDTIVFSRDINNFDPSLNPQDEIFLMDDDGTNPRQITADAHGDYEPSCSPDGQDVVFQRLFGYNAANGGEIVRIAICPGPGTCCSEVSASPPCIGAIKLTTNNVIIDDTEPSWSPGGTSIVFSSNNNGNNGVTAYNIFKMDATEGDSDPLIQLTFSDELDNRRPYWGETR